MVWAQGDIIFLKKWNLPDLECCEIFPAGSYTT